MATKKQAGNALVTAGDQVPAHLKDVIDSGDMRGSENVTSQDIQLPRLELAQALSAAVKKKDPDYIDGCEEGDFYNSLTRVSYGNEVYIVPVYFINEYLVWIDQDEGGGFRGSFETAREAEAEAQRVRDEENKKEVEVVKTAVHYCLLIDLESGTVEQVSVPMAKSKQRVNRKLNSLIQLAGGPRFSRVYQMTSVDATNANNQDYQNADIKMYGFVSQEVFNQAEEFYEMVKSMNVTTDYSDVSESDATPAEDAEY